MHVKIIPALVLVIIFPIFAEKPAPALAPVDAKFVQFLAGIELLDSEKNQGERRTAEKYAELCRITGLNSDSVVARIERYTDKPQDWQKVRIKVLELLKTLQ
jgi:hypothetical protein